MGDRDPKPPTEGAEHQLPPGDLPQGLCLSEAAACTNPQVNGAGWASAQDGRTWVKATCLGVSRGAAAMRAGGLDSGRGVCPARMGVTVCLPLGAGKVESGHTSGADLVGPGQPNVHY